MNTELVLGGRAVPNVTDRVRRYCGCRWRGGPPETWAWPYFDEVPSPNVGAVEPIDVLAAAALHPGLSRDDLAFFVQAKDRLSTTLGSLPIEVALGDADPDVVATVIGIAMIDAPVSLTLLSKVLHHVRPNLVPMVDRHILDWYRPVTAERSARPAWAKLVTAMCDDLAVKQNALTIASLQEQVATERGARPSALRVIDIAVWMAGRS